MTTTNETTKEKQIPAFYLFETVEHEGEKANLRVGAAFAHRKGGGLTLLIDGKRYVAFPPKAKDSGRPDNAH